jgi:hypothetical protein
MTAIEELEEQLKIILYYLDSDELDRIQELINQCKESEVKQSHDYAEFSIRCDRLDMKILNFDGYMNLQNTNK